MWTDSTSPIWRHTAEGGKYIGTLSKYRPCQRVLDIQYKQDLSLL